MSVPVILVSLAILYAAFGLLIAKFGLRGLACTRTFDRPAVFEGETGEMIETVRNDRPMLIPWLRVESRISPYLQLGGQDNLLVSDRTHACSLFTLMPFQQIRRRHKVAFLRRGAYNLGNATITVGDPLGAFQSFMEQRMDAPLLVYPRLLDDRELPAPLLSLFGEIASARNLLTDPFLIRGIRPYQAGDPIRDIHWAATARTGETHVRVHDYTAKAKLLVVFNGERKDGQWSDVLMDYEETDIEQVIAMAATLCSRALGMGLSAGFAANLPIGKENPSTVLLPAASPAREEELLTAFAQLTIKRTQSFDELLTSLAQRCEDLDVLVLSRYTNEKIESALQALRHSSCRVHLYLLGGETA